MTCSDPKQKQTRLSNGALALISYPINALEDVKKRLPYSHLAQSKFFAHEALPVKLNSLGGWRLRARLLRESLPSSLCEVIPPWNLTAASAPKRLVYANGGRRFATL